MAPSEQASAALADSLTDREGAQVLQDFSVQKGSLHFSGAPLKSAWRLSGVLALMGTWPELRQMERLAMRAEPDWAPDFGILGAMTSLVELRLSLSRHPIPPLPAGLRSLRLDLPGDLDLDHPALHSLHVYGADHGTVGAWALPALEELRLEQCRFLHSVETLPLGLQRLSLVELPLLRELPVLPERLTLHTVRCPMMALRP